MTKILIIRFSSIGDIIQCIGVVDGLKNRFPQAQIDWVTRKDMSSITKLDSRINRVWTLDRTEGFSQLLKLAWELRKEHYTHIYDAHNNIRSVILKICLFLFAFPIPRVAVRPKERIKRKLLFKFRINIFDWPFIGVRSYRKPLKRWKVNDYTPTEVEWNFTEKQKSELTPLINQKTITLVPSANWEMKRWPISHWRRLIELLPEHNFIILAGPSDTFCTQIADVASERVVNLAGKSSLIDSCYLVSISNLVVSADTGFLHAADLFWVKSIALLGPTAFGYPMDNHTSTVLELNMSCRPCTKDGRGNCSQDVYQQCLAGITPEVVAENIIEKLNKK